MEIKQLVTLITTFVDNNVIVLLDNNSLQHHKAIHQWNDLKQLLDKSDLHEIEQFVYPSFANSFSTNHIKPPSIGQSLINKTPQKYSFNDQFNDSINIIPKYQNTQYKDTQSVELKKPFSVGFALQTKQQTDMIDKLLLSFQKLCKNFQNNHQKLMNRIPTQYKN